MKKLLVITLALVFCFAALPAFAQEKADWSWYGSVRMWTAWEMASEETQLAAGLNNGSKAKGWRALVAPGTFALQDDDVLDWQLQTNSRVGANVKWGNIGGTIEFGQDGAAWNGSKDTRASIRLMSATWNFGSGTLLIGKNYTPYFFLVSNLCGPGGGECNGIGFGSIYGGRRDQITLQFGGFKFGLAAPETGNNPSDIIAFAPWNPPAANGVDIDQWLPRIEASYTFSAGPLAVFLGGAWQTYDIEVGSATGIQKVDTDSWALGLGVKSSFGPFYANFTGQWGQNIGQGGLSTILQFSRSLINPLNYSTEDNQYLTAQLILGFRLTDSLSFEGGVIWQEGDADIPGGTPLSGSVSQDSWVYYLNASWSPAKNFFIIPEIGLIDNGDLSVSGLDDQDLGDVTWFGIKWQINF
jgi:hypothetical protein